MDVWIVAITGFGGSMGEAFFGQTMLGPFDKQRAEDIAREYNDRPEVVDSYDERTAEAFKLTSPPVTADAASVVNSILQEDE